MRAFVTGATGFIGGRLARLLLREGWDVTCLVRTPSKAAALEEAGARLAPGDVTDPPSLEAPMRGADAVFHLAAWYAIGVSDAAGMDRINVGGTANVIEAAVRAGVPKIVYCSSVAALGANPRGVVGDESKEHDGRYSSTYERSKHLAHERARTLARAGAPVVQVMPGAVYGLGDDSVMMLMMRAYARRLLVACPFLGAGVSMVHVEDVARGHLLACEKASPGDELLLCGDNCTVGDVFRRAAPLTGIPAPRVEMPVWMMRALAPLGPLVARPLRQPPGFIREGITSLAGSWMFSSAKAEREIGYRWRPVEEGVPETVASVR